jgi:hypothetical protein
VLRIFVQASSLKLGLKTVEESNASISVNYIEGKSIIASKSPKHEEIRAP